MILSIWSKLESWSESLKAFMLDHDQNVLLYTLLFIVGLIIFAIVFNMMNKEQ